MTECAAEDNGFMAKLKPSMSDKEATTLSVALVTAAQQQLGIELKTAKGASPWPILTSQ